MRAVDSSELWQEGCRNTLLVAEKVDPTGMFEFHNLMPRFPVPEGETEESWFRKETFAGLARRYPDGIPEGHVVQAEYELGVINQMGFPSYFLVVADFIQWAKNQGIAVGPGRGSAAGSLVAYALGITDLDPIQHGLIFERFLNPERVSMPDVDIDFDERRRGEVIKYVTDKWGEDKVAQIATFGTIKAKAAIKDSARVLGLPVRGRRPDHQGDAAGRDGQGHPAHRHLRPQAPPLRRGRRDPRPVRVRPGRQKVIDTAKGIEGLIRQTGVHAAGVIMSAEPIIEHIPLMRRDADGAIITQFDYPTCESLGLLKMDFLGLRNLTIIDDAVKNIELNHGTKLDLLAPAAGRQGRVRAAGPRRHPGRVPARRRADAVAAAADEAGQLRGHLRRPGAVPARPDGRRLAHQLRAAQERPPGDHPDPPGAGGAAAGDPRRPPTA